MRNESLPHADMWIISDGRYADLDLKGILDSIDTATAVRPIEYEISDLAKYLLSPNPVEVKKRLVGYEIHYDAPSSGKVRNRLQGMLRRILGNKEALRETFILDCGPKMPDLKDKDLESYMTQVHSLLRRENPVLEQLSKLDATGISDVKGICKGIGGNRSQLNLRGSIEDKIDYVRTYICNDVGVILEKPQISHGLFDMRAFDFESFNSQRSHNLIKLTQDGEPKCCVLGSNNKVEYWIDGADLLDYMQLLQQSIRTNPHLNEALELCAHGEAQAVKLLFYEQLQIDYSKVNCPEVYKEVIQSGNMSANERDLVINSLNNRQLGISFNYILQPNSGEKNLVTTISVMHDIRALQPIKDNFPNLYSQISNRVSGSGVGNYYLLDSIRGCTYEQ
jgi:hypothetical protein